MKEETPGLWNIISIVWKRVWIIFLITLVAVLTSAFISFNILNPIYQANVSVLISGHLDTENPDLTSSIDESLKLVPTYQDIVQSPLIVKAAQSQVNEEGYDFKVDPDSITIHQKDESQVFEIAVEDKDSNAAKLVADSLAASFNEEVKDLMNLKENNVKVLNSATVDPDPVSPRPFLIMGITFILALLVSIWIALLMHHIARK